MTYRAHCLGVRLRRALKKRRRYPLISGEQYSYSSIEVRIDGQTFRDVGSLEYEPMFKPTGRAFPPGTVDMRRPRF